MFYRHTPTLGVTNRQFPSYQRQPQEPQSFAQHSLKLTNGSLNASVAMHKSVDPSLIASQYQSPFKSLESQVKPVMPDGRRHHVSRLATFHSSNCNHQRDSTPPYVHQRSPEKYNSSYKQSVSEHSAPEFSLPRSYLPYHAYPTHISKPHQDVNSYQSFPQRSVVDGVVFQETQYASPVLPRRVPDITNAALMSPYQQRRITPERRWRSPSGSPLSVRNYLQTDEEQQYSHSSTSPILLQRRYHQQKQHQQAREAEEVGKSDFACPCNMWYTVCPCKNLDHK